MKGVNFLIRTLYYFRNGYGIYLGLPIGVLSFSTTVYYLMIQNVPFLKRLFPGFIEFMVVLIVVIYPLGAIIGWIHFKKWFYRVEQDIIVESNPYSNTKLAPISVPLYKLLMEIAKKNGIDVTEMEILLGEDVKK